MKFCRKSFWFQGLWVSTKMCRIWKALKVINKIWDILRMFGLLLLMFQILITKLPLQWNFLHLWNERDILKLGDWCGKCVNNERKWKSYKMSISEEICQEPMWRLTLIVKGKGHVCLFVCLRSSDNIKLLIGFVLDLFISKSF